MKLKRIVAYLAIIMVMLLPRNISAKTIEEMIEEGEVTLKSVPITSEDTFWMYTEKFGMEYVGYYFEHESCNADYTSCDLYYQGEKVKKVNINYEYDPAVKTVVDNIMKKIPEGGKIFNLNDIENIKYILAYANYEPAEGEEYYLNPINFSGEYKKFIGYNNFIYEPRMGYEEMFASFNGGTATFEYDGVVYGATDGMGIKAQSLLYVNDNETDIVGALKKKKKKYFPNIVSITKDETTLQDIIDDYLDYERSEYNSCQTRLAELETTPESERDGNWHYNRANLTSECYNQLGYDTVDEYLDNYYEDMITHGWEFYDIVEPNVYVIEFDDGLMVGFFVVKDSSKVFDEDIAVITSDSSSGVTISTDELIPLDTLIEVARITDGETYEKIVNLLETTDVDMFDLKLFSKSASEYITTLDNGKFEVKLPIKEEFVGKELKVYYVNSNDEITEYPVTIKDGYAIFTTDHFSIYTLASTGNELPTTTNNTTTTNNPETSDNYLINMTLLLVSIISLASLIIYRKLAKNY